MADESFQWIITNRRVNVHSSNKQLTVHIPSLLPPQWECCSIHHHYQHEALPCHPQHQWDGSNPSGIGKYEQYYRSVRPVAVENRKNIDSGLNNVTSERIIGRRELSMDNHKQNSVCLFQQQAIDSAHTVVVAASMGMSFISPSLLTQSIALSPSTSMGWIKS